REGTVPAVGPGVTEATRLRLDDPRDLVVVVQAVAQNRIEVRVGLLRNLADLAPEQRDRIETIDVEPRDLSGRSRRGPRQLDVGTRLGDLQVADADRGLLAGFHLGIGVGAVVLLTALVAGRVDAGAAAAAVRAVVSG